MSAEEVRELAEAINSSDENSILKGLEMLRWETVKQNINNTRIIDNILSIDFLLPRLLNIIDNLSHGDKITEQAIWILVNITAGNSEQTSRVMEANAVPLLLSLLSKTNSEKILENIWWTLANIAGDSKSLRDKMVKCDNLMSCILNTLKYPLHKSSLKCCLWTLCNIVRHHIDNNFMLDEYWPMLHLYLQHQDTDIVSHCLWILHYFTGRSIDNKRIEIILQENFLPEIIELTSRKTCEQIISPAIRIFADVLSGNQNNTQEAIDLGVIPIVLRIISEYTGTNNQIVKESVFALSNIAAGTKTQLSELLNDCSIIPHLMNLYDGYYGDDINNEICWTLINLIHGGTDLNCVQLVKSTSSRAFAIISHFLTNVDTRNDNMTLLLLESMQKLLHIADNFKLQNKANCCCNHKNRNLYASMFKLHGKVVETLVELSVSPHTNKSCKIIASSMLSKYFNVAINEEDDGDDIE